MNVTILTREYPPHVYGGAGVHVEHLARELARLATVEVRCFGDQDLPGRNPAVRGYPSGDRMFDGNPAREARALEVLLAGLRITAEPVEADVVHGHTWYAAWPGIISRLVYGTPLVMTVHSLEPLRPWKREQLGRGYDLSAWLERTALEMADAVIAVSAGERGQILRLFDLAPDRVHVIPNGIDTETYRPIADKDALRRHGIDPGMPYALFLGRLSRQKGIDHFLEAAGLLDGPVQVVICASSPDTPEIGREVAGAVARLRREGLRTVWINAMVPRAEAIQLYSHAALFCCPSVYEPFGIINLEAMACETPVVASAVGGIPDVVRHGETGLLVPVEPAGDGHYGPADPGAFAGRLAGAMQSLLDDPDRGREMGRRGREVAAALFGWDRVAARVLDLYRSVGRPSQNEEEE